MRFSEQLLLIFALAMDGFAASLCMGVSLSGMAQGLLVAAVVTAFHAILFAAGYLVGSLCAPAAAVAPWIGALLLSLLGIHMLREAQKPEQALPRKLAMRRAAALGFSTSVDAMTTGFSFALLSVGLFGPLALVAAVMGTLSLFGVTAGRRIGGRFRHRARLAGGALLLAMGLKNLLALM